MTRVAGIVVVAALLAGCGSSGETTGTTSTTQRTAPARTVARGPVPPVMETVESASEDTIDFALAGQRAKAVATTRRLKAAADGPAVSALRKVGVSAAQIDEFQRRAAAVAALAPKAPLLDVALASNRAFAMVPAFFAHYKTRVPPVVGRLDYLDFEAKLRARARQNVPLRAAVGQLDTTWRGMRPAFVKAGGTRVAPSFDAHVHRMLHLAADGSDARAVHEAQHGLDLVDRLESVYKG
jgi:hypothetical protein